MYLCHMNLVSHGSWRLFSFPASDFGALLCAWPSRSCLLRKSLYSLSLSSIFCWCFLHYSVGLIMCYLTIYFSRGFSTKIFIMWTLCLTEVRRVLNEPTQTVFANSCMHSHHPVYRMSDNNETYWFKQFIWHLGVICFYSFWTEHFSLLRSQWVIFLTLTCFCFVFFTNHLNFTNMLHVKVAQDCWSQLQSDPRWVLQVQ